MNTLAFHAGPGPWILLFPLFWGAAFFVVSTLLRRAGWRGRRGGRAGRGGGPRGPWRPSAPAHDDQSPIAMLGRRFAAGEIDEDEYWRRLSVLDEQFGDKGRTGAV
ncbi:SHOCT domain-containing protein [Streptomyces corynorhini]|uniref:SHOCT domain-containing protein n=1 Tax=Streptomyces corynorhini TaxID=2282652 RepID=A0A370B2H4_9ACTN|nr:SHOCT domain-containing protein [Streptomyces corynorhini]RDG36018.1 SHOCT domain-containing protein [Streptomyces corynorhini]